MIINFLALIPARMGSKRIKRKNLIKLHNKKLIQYTLESSIQSKKINKILLSTDDPMVIKLGKKFKVDFIIKRPQKFSKENTSMEVVIDHTLEFLKNHGIKVKNIVLLQPTTPFRTSGDIDRMIEYYKRKKLNHCVSVSGPITNSLEIFHTKNRFINLNQNKKYKNYKHLFLNGSIYIFKVENFLKNKKILTSKVNYFVQGLNNSIDINNNLDLEIAKSFKNQMKNYETTY